MPAVQPRDFCIEFPTAVLGAGAGQLNVAPAGVCRLAYDGANFFLSANGGAWVVLAAAAGAGWIDNGAQVNLFAAATAAAPNADGTQSLGVTGVGGKIWANVFANVVEARTNATDANPTVRLSIGGVRFGAGGGAPLDNTIERLGLSVLGVSNGAGGAGSLAPFVDASGTCGTTGAAGKVWASANAVVVATRASGADANPNAQVGASSLQLGLGVAAALDWSLARSAALPAGTAALGGGQFLDAIGAGGFEVRGAAADANPQAQLNASTLAFGAGAAAVTDVSLRRSAAATLAMTATSVQLLGRVRVLPGRPAGLVGANNDFAGFAGTTYVTITSAAAASLTGIAAGADGDMLTILNGNATTGATITLNNENAGSLAANRLKCVGNVDLALGGRQIVTFIYDGSLQRWLQRTAAITLS